MSEQPWLYVVAGPNGAGKSTLAQLLLPRLPVVNPDDIARAISPHAPELAAFTAGREALKHVQEHLNAARSSVWKPPWRGGGSSGSWGRLDSPDLL